MQLDEYKMNNWNLQKTVSSLRNEIAARDQPVSYYDNDISATSSLKRMVENTNDCRSTMSASMIVKEEENIFHDKISKAHTMMNDIETLLQNAHERRTERQKYAR